MSTLDILSVNTIRGLSADAVQKANSGHPGLPLGAAPMAFELWANHMKHNPKNPNWIDRDRFILSGGHGSALLYSMLHVFGYGGLSIEDLKQFRQLDSRTPGHPEFGHTIGVEATTGPLGAGMAMAVGMAIAETHLAAKFNKEDNKIIDHFTYVLGGDGCMMEGISTEAFSLAGTLQLGKLIVFYDSNQISIEGSTDIAFREDVVKKVEALGFHTVTVEDGNDLTMINKAIEEAKTVTNKPSLICVKTKIGYGCPAKEGKASAHGEPLGVDNVRAMKENLGLDPDKDFYVKDEVYDHINQINSKNQQIESDWNDQLKAYFNAYPEMKKLWDDCFSSKGLEDVFANEEFWEFDEKPEATRNVSGIVMNRIKDLVPNFIGGAADLAPSTKTYLNGAGDYSDMDRSGRNLHFGVRELAMAAIGNGMVLHGGLRAFVSTFFVFSDYVKPMARLSALMGLPLTYVLTHDSIGVGEDGPTHEPIEQLAMLRSMPNFSVFRPADATETLASWYFAMCSQNVPTGIVLSRQNLPQLEGSNKEGVLKGGYVISPSKKELPDGILMASGSEVSLAIQAQEELLKEGMDVRVVSMPSMDEFEKQSKEYRLSVLPNDVRARVAIEAGTDFGWGKYVGIDGDYVTMKSFGASAPADKLFVKFGFTVENVVNTMKNLLNK